MLEQAAGPEGTAPAAQIAGYRVAGKTGTVHKSVAGGYSDDKYLAVFAGMAPASDPRLVMVVMIDEPANGKYYGGQVAAPVFSKVISGALRLLAVPPDNLPLLQTKQVATGGCCMMTAEVMTQYAQPERAAAGISGCQCET